MNNTLEDDDNLGKKILNGLLAATKLFFNYVFTPILRGISNGAGLSLGAFIFKYFIFYKYLKSMPVSTPPRLLIIVDDKKIEI